MSFCVNNADLAGLSFLRIRGLEIIWSELCALGAFMTAAITLMHRQSITTVLAIHHFWRGIVNHDTLY